MRTALSRTVVSLSAFLFLLFFGLALFASEKTTVAPVPESAVVKSEVTLTGVIEATDEDDNGRVRSVSLSCMNDLGEYDYYSIENKGKGRDLLKVVGETVKITGKLRTDKARRRTLSVGAYQVIRDEPEKKDPDAL